MTQTGEHQFQFLDVVTSSIPPDDITTPHAVVTGAAHYYASLPPPPAPMYVFIDQSGSIYPALTSGAGTALSTSGYVQPVAPLMTPQMQSAGVVLPPGVIPTAQTLLRPGLMQQPQPASVIMPAPTGILPPPPTSIIPSHATIRPLPPHNVSEIPVSELALSASAGYSGQPLIAGTNDLAFNSMPVDMHIGGAGLAQHDGMYVGSGACNVNNSAAEHPAPPCSDTERSSVELVGSLDRHEQTDAMNHDTQFEHSLDTVASGHGNGLATYEDCTGSDGGVEFQEATTVADSQPEVAPVNGELSVDSSHELGSLSETSSVTSPSSLVADMTLNDNASERDVCAMSTTKDSSHSPLSAMKDHSHSPVMNASTQQSSPIPACVSPPSAVVKPKAPSWASLLKDTTSATNAIVINMNDSHAAASAQLKTDVKTVVKEPVTPQSAISHVSNDEKLKLQISGL